MARLLLDAQVEFLQSQVSGDQLASLVETEVVHALAAAERLTLEEVVSREQIKTVSQKYAALMDIQGSIPELVGEISERVYSHHVQHEYPVGEVIGREHVAELVGKLLEMQSLRERLLDRVTESPVTITWVTWLLHRLVTDFVGHSRERAKRVPGVSSLFAAGGQLLGRVLPHADKDVDLLIEELAARSARVLLRHAGETIDGSTGDAPVFDAAMQLWDDHAGEPVSSFLQYVSRDDLEDLLVIGYEFWLDFRHTAYFRSLLDQGVDFFFDKYGDFSLRELLEEVGVRHEDLVEEAMRFAPRVIEVLRANDLLAGLLRRRLEPFFSSEDVVAILDHTTD